MVLYIYRQHIKFKNYHQIMAAVWQISSYYTKRRFSCNYCETNVCIIISASLTIHKVWATECKCSWYTIVTYLIRQSVCLLVWKVYCGKTADWIQMPFWVVSGVGRGMGVLDGVEIVKGEGAVLEVNVGHPIVTNDILCGRGGDALFPNDWGGLVISLLLFVYLLSLYCSGI